MYYKSLLNKKFKIVSSKITISGTLVLGDSRDEPFIENAEINLIQRDGSVLNANREEWYLDWGSSFECFRPLCYAISKEDYFALFSDGVPVYSSHDIFEYVRK